MPDFKIGQEVRMFEDRKIPINGRIFFEIKKDEVGTIIRMPEAGGEVWCHVRFRDMTINCEFDWLKLIYNVQYFIELINKHITIKYCVPSYGDNENPRRMIEGSFTGYVESVTRDACEPEKTYIEFKTESDLKEKIYIHHILEVTEIPTMPIRFELGDADGKPWQLGLIAKEELTEYQFLRIGTEALIKLSSSNQFIGLVVDDNPDKLEMTFRTDFGLITCSYQYLAKCIVKITDRSQEVVYIQRKQDQIKFAQAAVKPLIKQVNLHFNNEFVQLMDGVSVNKGCELKESIIRNLNGPITYKKITEWAFLLFEQMRRLKTSPDQRTFVYRKQPDIIPVPRGLEIKQETYLIYCLGYWL